MLRYIIHNPNRSVSGRCMGSSKSLWLCLAKRCGRGMENRNSLTVSGVYVLDRYCIGGSAMARIMDSKGTDKGLLPRTLAIPVDPALELRLQVGLATDDVIFALRFVLNLTVAFEPSTPDPEQQLSHLAYSAAGS